MPYKSKAQQKFFHANEKKIGKAKVREWDNATDFKHLPKRLNKKTKAALKLTNQI